MKEKLEMTVERLQYGAEAARGYIDLLADPGQLYKRASDTVRRDLLLAYFEKLDVYLRNEGLEVEAGRNEGSWGPHSPRRSRTRRRNKKGL